MTTVSSLPPFLLAEVRTAFQTCRSLRSGYALHPATYRRQLREISGRSHPQHPSAPTTEHADSKKDDAELEGQDAREVAGHVSTTDLVPQRGERRSVGAGRPVEVPLKVVPKAELLSPKLKLSPRERLHIEALTRRNPRTLEKKIYKEKLLIYHQGTGRETVLIFTKFFSVVGLAVNTTIMVPALYTASSPLWICALTFIAGLVPITTVHALTAPIVNRIYLHLPTKARESPQAAMEYARNLPGTAILDIEVLRPAPLPINSRALLADLEVSSTRWRPATFQWKAQKADMLPKTSWLWPKPREFFVKPESAKGRAARYTVPGIWPSVYKRLAGEESQSVSRWKR